MVVGSLVKPTRMVADIPKVQICNIIDRCADVTRDGKLEVSVK